MSNSSGKARFCRLAVVAAGLAAALALTACGGATTHSSAKTNTKAHSMSDHMGSMTGLMAGDTAPGGSFTTISGQTMTVASLRGHPALIWFVTTWCPVCQAGTRAMAAHLVAGLAGEHVKVIELMNHGNLGHPGNMTAFMTQYAGSAYHNADWIIGTASAGLTHAFNPKGEMDIYYLLDSTGHVRYVNFGPAATGTQLLAHASGLS